ncbi:hypothetical protein [Chamaesiphon minutus]|uniref:Uncharacterized protein n=1 Tax=Chamaesiphon minutus (strain ATCC 27169 / PCC 6605) TaxID=1173020 RepID=K9UKT5_CHAP6|nr:hypothetical protein [Chamaesiphon minutus]AFY95435.1 hypothetical protein Cha6605_4507 [Chamaesiphon minutus PCC 6605]
MKTSIYLTAIATTVITCLGMGSARAQGVFVQPFPSTGYSSTTIFVPSNVPDRGYTSSPSEYGAVDPNLYQNNRTFGSTTTIYDYSPNYGSKVTYGSSYRNYRKPAQVTCSTSIIGSPIPSPIALGANGQPCR